MTPHDRAMELVTMVNDDLYVARVLLPDPKVSDSMVGFHLQQTVEKLLKALWQNAMWTTRKPTVSSDSCILSVSMDMHSRNSFRSL
jgi:hypothetical protein